MLKARKLAAVLPIVFLFVLALNGQTLQPLDPSTRAERVHQGQGIAEKNNTNPAYQQRGTKDSPFFVEKVDTPKTDKETADDQNKKREEASDKRISRLFNVLLAGVGSGQLLVMGLQWWIFRRQTDLINKQRILMERQTKVQEAAMDQWVSLDSWKSDQVTYGTENTLNVSFQLLNPTGHSLTLKNADMTFGVKRKRHIFVYRRIPLPPNKPLTITIPVVLDPLKMNTFRTNTLGLSVEGKIVFINALKDEIEQAFSGVLSCNMSETKFESSMILRPEVDVEEQDKKSSLTQSLQSGRI